MTMDGALISIASEVCMTVTSNLREQLAEHDPEYRQLLEEHQARDRRLQELRGKGWLTTEEEQEAKRLKKEKLSLKDKMEAHIRKKSA
jgi:uncharacterized protein YdcH (DUF465 family)